MYFLIALCVAFSCMAGCSGQTRLTGSLSDFYEQLPDDLTWKKEKESRLPQNEVERSVVQVAADHRIQKQGSTSIMYVSRKEQDTYVATAESLSESPSLFNPKKVVRYVVQAGRIRATMGPCLEPFPDAVLERSLLAVTERAVAGGGWVVVPVLDWVEPVVFKGVVQGKCRVEIAIYRAENGPGELICTRTVNPCPP